MHDRAFSAPECTSRRPPLGLRAALIAIVLTISWTADAQTLTDPSPKAPPARLAGTKSRAASTKGCSQYGTGFVQIAGSGACVKIGGYVTVEGSR